MGKRLNTTALKLGVALLACWGVVTACDDLVSPRTIPTPSSAPAPANAAPLPAAVTTEIAVPPQNSPKFGTVDWTGLPAPESTWVRISVQGSISVATNPYYIQLFNGPAKYDGLTVGPEGYLYPGAGNGELALAVRVHNSVGEVLRFGAAGTEGESPITFIPRGGRLRWQRDGIIGVTICMSDYCDPPGFSGEVPHYVLRGSQAITVRPVPVPLRVVPGREVVSPGDTVHFTSQEDVPMIPAGRRWFWVRNDTLPRAHEVANPFGDGRYVFIARCAGMPTCAYAPPGNGRMHHTASHNGLYGAHASSPIIRVDTLRVSVACTPSVVRGATVRCEATWSPSSIPAADINFEWRFDADSVRVFPHPSAPAFDPPPSVDTTASGLRTWFGPVVVGGRVSLRVSHAGVIRTDSARFTITARTGANFGDLPVSFAAGFSDVPTDSTLPLTSQPPPEPGGSLGMVGQNYDTQSGRGRMDDAIHGTPTLAEVPSGPNAGYWYVLAPNVRSTRGVRMRTWITGRESPKFRYPPVPGQLTNRGLLEARRTHPNPQAPRMHSDSAELFLGVLAHESYGRNGRKGHQGQIEVAAKSLATCGRVPALLERVVAADSGTARDVARVVTEEGRKSLYAAAWHNHVYGNYSNAPFYEVVPTVTPAVNLPWNLAAGDPQQAAHPQVAPDATFRCTRVY